MFSTQSDNCILIYPYFDILSVFAAEFEEPKTGISGKGLNAYCNPDFNPLPHMPILGSSNSAATKNMMSKIWTNQVVTDDHSFKHGCFPI